MSGLERILMQVRVESGVYAYSSIITGPFSRMIYLKWENKETLGRATFWGYSWNGRADSHQMGGILGIVLRKGSGAVHI